MRLKGGKLLLDLSNYNIENEFEIQLTDEQFNAILSKGLAILINSSVAGKKFYTDLNVSSIDGETIIFQAIITSGGSEKGFILYLETKKLTNEIS